MLFDFSLGLIIFLLALNYQTTVLTTVHTFGARLHIDQLRSNVDWLMGFPSGFKPNAELDKFIGNWLLKILDYWYNLY